MKYITSIEQLVLAEGMEKGRAEGMEKGIAEGMEKGIAEGMEKGIAELRPGLLDGIALALELRYGADHPLLPCVLEELQAITDVARLTAAQQAIRTAPTLEAWRAANIAESQ